MKRLTYLLLCLILGIGVAAAQRTIKVTGTILSAEDDEPVIGAAVVVKGTTIGTVTDIDGKFVLDVPSDAKTIFISYVGMRTKELPVTPVVNVKLESESLALSEVVVTALGIKKSEKALGYAASTIKSDDLAAAKSGSVMSGLTGRVAGVNIATAGNAGTSQKVLIRGISSLNSNQPLYIVDGVPINNDRISNKNSDNQGTDADFGNGANDINPEDVESITVLKGASATALYGSRASNGVIMVTTKRAKAEKLTISYDGSFTASNVLRVMQTQDMFGQGWGSWDRAENGSWGPRLDGTMHEWGSPNLDPVMEKPFSYVKDNIRNFYKTGTELNNVISLRYGTEKLGLVASYGNLTSNGILPNDGDTYSRNTFSLRGNAQVNKFSFDMSMNYVRKDIHRTVGMDNELLQHAVDVDYSQMKDYNDERYNLDNYYTHYATNPYWMIDNNYYLYQDDRIYGKVEMSYDVLPGLRATGRLGGDFMNYRKESRQAKTSFTDGSYSKDGGATPEQGYYSNYRNTTAQIDATAFLTADYTVGDFNIGGSVGWNLNQRAYSYEGAYIEGLDIEGWYDVQNTTSAAVSQQYTEKRRLIGLFAQAEAGYKGWLFLNLSLRNDWSSTLPKDGNSFFYGGGNVSFLLSELFPAMKEKSIDFLKVRAAIGQTGNDANVYKTSSWYTPVGNFTGTNFYYTYLPLGGVSGLSEYNYLPSSTLKPEMTTEYEFGVSGNFLDNRISVDVAYYNKQTKDQIISATLAPETGYTKETRNVGQLENQGIEAMLNVTPVRTKDWEWEVGATFTKNWSKVVELWDGLDEYTYTTWRGIEYVMKVGEPVGVFRIPSVATVTDKDSPFYGYQIVNNNGFLTQSNTEKEVVGASQPDFILGLNTSLKWKNLRLTVVGDWHKGGYLVSHTSYISHFNGNSTQTVFNERNSFVYPQSVKVVNGEYVENNIPVKANQMNYAVGNYSYNPELRRDFILPRDYFKIREITLTYDFPGQWLKKTPFTKVAVSLIGRNLFLITAKKNNYVDPEATNMGNDLYSEFGETTGVSSTRNIGGALKVVF